MFHFTQFRPESTRQRRLHQNSERHERCRRQEDVCYLESEFFAETLLLLLSAVRLWSRRVAVTFLSKIFFLLRSSFYRPVVFIRPAILSHSAASPSFWPLPFRVIFSGQTGPSWPTVFSLPIPSSLGQRLVLKNCGQLVLSTDFLRSLEKFGHFPVWKYLEKIFLAC